MSIDRWVDKQNVVYIHNEILFSPIKEQNSNTCYNKDEPWRPYAKWNKSDTKRQALYHSTYIRVLEYGDDRDRKLNSGCQGLGGEGGEDFLSWVPVQFGRMVVA